jgi:glutamate racemase
MRILITDSGVGGVSVVAFAERFVRTSGFTEPVHLTFANAAPANDYGYNSMPSYEAKIETFDRFLRNVTERYTPDRIYVACNTLSVLLPDVHPTVPIKGIIETGVTLLLEALEKDPRSIAMIFATQTTTDAGAYPRHLQERGIDASRIISQACPGLADTISEDREGTKARAEIEKWVAIAMKKMPSPGLPIVACLACTHYGYRKDLFAAALCHPERSEGPGWSGGRSIAPPARPGPSLTLGMTQVINPNESAVGDLFDRTGDSRDVDVEFVTRYALPDTTIATLTWLLQDISRRTVDAMQHFEHVPDLF